MGMNIKVKWGRPVRLIKCRKKSDCIMEFREMGTLGKITDGPGVYVFARRHGRTDEDIFIPQYIGEASNVRRRIRQHLHRHVARMRRIRDGATGARYLVVGKIERNAKNEKTRKVVENALIKKAMANGHNLLNKQGTKSKVHSIQFTGTQSAKNTFGNEIHVPVTRRRK